MFSPCVQPVRAYWVEVVAAGSFRLTAEDACRFCCLDFVVTHVQEMNSTKLKGLTNKASSQQHQEDSPLKTSPVALNQSPAMLVSFLSDAVARISSSHRGSSLIFQNAILSRAFCSTFSSGRVLGRIKISASGNWADGLEPGSVLVDLSPPSHLGSQVGLGEHIS